MTSQSSFLVPMLLMCVIWYFLLIRPQQKRAKEHKIMLEAMKKGDQVITQGGIYGKVVSVAAEKNTAEIEIAKGVNITVVKSTVQAVVVK